MVRFECEQHFVDVIPKPKPAMALAPKFYKALKAQMDNHPSSGTVKRCVPFREAMGAGFIIPLWADMFVEVEGEDITTSFPENFQQSDSIQHHNYDQMPGHPKSGSQLGKVYLKFINPWIVTTDPGISCLFTSPLNHMESRFKLIDGVVDTDNYYNNINFPFIWTGGDGKFFIPKGTPVAQVIPFRREEHEAEYGVIDMDKRGKVSANLGTKMKNAYQDLYWNKAGGTSDDQDVS